VTQKSRRSYAELQEADYSHVYAQLALKVLNEITNAGKPYLPPGVGLVCAMKLVQYNMLIGHQNVNFPSIIASCSAPENFRFVLSRIYPGEVTVGITVQFAEDVETCGRKILPTENEIISTGCIASISVFGENKLDANKDEQAFVLNKLTNILSCL
jgi:hypothetical protein